VLVGSGQLTDRHAVRLTETILAGLLPRESRRAPVRPTKRKATRLQPAAAD
jgi:hypothetical protein